MFLWMLLRVARVTEADQVVVVEGKLRKSIQVFLVMYFRCLLQLAVASAYLALIVISRKDRRALSLPFRRGIKGIIVMVRHGHKKSPGIILGLIGVEIWYGVFSHFSLYQK